MFWGPGHQRPDYSCSFPFTMRRSSSPNDLYCVEWDVKPYSTQPKPPCSARSSAIYFLPFGKVWLGSVCRVQRLGNEAERTIYGGWGENSGSYTLSLVWTKVHEIFRRCRKLLVLFNAAGRLSMSRFIRPPDIVCRRTYILPVLLSSSFFFSPPNLRGRWTELNENRLHGRK